jgi:tripartite-type tricarboxylate transporter receptor subunit TctC
VTQSLPAKTVKELIALAKAKPGVLNYASTGDGGGAHLAAELFRAMADVNIERIPYKGGGDALNAVIGGQVHIMFATAASGMPHVKSGRLNVLAVTTTQPSALVPGVPTVAASGLPGYESAAVFAMFAPATTPAALRDLIHKKIVDTLARADMKERLFKVGLEPVGSSPDELTAFMKINISRLGKVIRDAGIRAE